MKQKIKKKNVIIILYVILTIIVGLFVFFSAPNLNPLYSEGAFFWLVLITIYSILPLLSGLKLEQTTDSHGRMAINFAKGENKIAKSKKLFLVVLASLWVLFILINLINVNRSWGMEMSLERANFEDFKNKYPDIESLVKAFACLECNIIKEFNIFSRKKFEKELYGRLMLSRFKIQ
ncbi:MAG: hypothetical protein RSA99_01705, partial [Oscillospiraceae bacterium]